MKRMKKVLRIMLEIFGLFFGSLLLIFQLTDQTPTRLSVVLLFILCALIAARFEVEE